MGKNFSFCILSLPTRSWRVDWSHANEIKHDVHLRYIHDIGCQEKSYPGEIVPKRNRTQIKWVRFLWRNRTLGTISPEISYQGYDFSRDIVPCFYNVTLRLLDIRQLEKYILKLTHCFSVLRHCLSLFRNILRLACISHQKL